MFGSFGIWELLVILAIVVLMFGVGRLPQLGKGLGEGIANFRDSVKGKDKDAKASLEENKEQHS
ncbi:MAG: Sec-independent protein translocase subunit TatA/TatB [Thermoanaerobaculia bacterium]